MAKSRSSFFSARNVAYLGVLSALVIVLQLWGSIIPIGAAGLNLSFVLVPISLGAMLLGPGAGAFLGLVFGLVVFITGACGMNFFTLYLFQNNPLMTAVICLVKGVGCGLVGALVYKPIAKKNKIAAVFTAAAVVPIVNTGLFILGCLCISGTIRNFASENLSISSDNIMYIIIVGLVTVNFFIELALNLVCAPALYTVDRVVEKQFSRKSKKRGRRPHSSAGKSVKVTVDDMPSDIGAVSLPERDVISPADRDAVSD
ncbi:MAG: ECF transporter S component [Clostridia bacterium]|nr:ECF transporter S component [Clostridia bacterium]